MVVINCVIHSVYYLHRLTKPECFPYQFCSHVMPRHYIAQFVFSDTYSKFVSEDHFLKPFDAMTVVKSNFSQCCITLIILHIFLQAKEHNFPQFKLL